MTSSNKFKKLADYIATFCVNLAVIGIGLAFFEGKDGIGVYLLSLGAFIIGGVITWRAGQ